MKGTQHERLCAYLFGELDAAERTAVEAELAASPELRAERERIESTIALVQEAIPAEEALSSAARAELTSAAAAERPGNPDNVLVGPGWSSARPPLAAAAAILLTLGAVGFLGYRMAQRDAAAPAWDQDAVATAPVDEEEEAGGRTVGKLDDRTNLAAQKLADNARAGVRREEPPTSQPAAPSEATEKELTSLGVSFDRDEDDLLSFSRTPVERDATRSDELSDEQQQAGRRSESELNQLGYAELAEREATRQKIDELRQQEAAGEISAGARVLVADGKTRPAEALLPDAPEVRLLKERKAATGGGAAAPPPPGASGPSSPGPAGTPSPGRYAELRRGAVVHAEEPVVRSRAFRVPVQNEVSGEKAKNLAELLITPVGGEAFYEDGADGFYLGRGQKKRHYEFAWRFNSAADADAYCDEVVRFCRIRPQETPSMMFFRCWGDNPFELTQLDALSTFAADVDTASYALARNYLNRGLMPTKAQIRTEEFVNYFDSGVPAPAKDVFDVDLELAPSLFGKNGEWMLRVVLAGKEVDKAERQNMALTFVVDTSGSMKQENRIELVKHALRLLVGELFPNDAIAIVAFSTEARLVLPMTSAANKGVIESAIYGLHADGSTNAEAGLMMGYELAGAALTGHAQNRVVLLSDGVANVGNTDEKSILAKVEHQRQKGIYLNTVGVGMGNHNDALLEQLADKGDGLCNYIDTPDEAYKALVENFTGAFQSIARDVKIQVEFDPAQVQSYRLLGYENRTVADRDFRNDAVDAGEVGAGHQVTALYELVQLPGGTGDGPLATARVRYKEPFAVDRGELSAEAREAAEVAAEVEESIGFDKALTSFQGATAGYQRSVLAAQFAEFLRRSVHARGDSYDLLLAETLRLEKVTEDADFTEFCQLVHQRRELILANLPQHDEIAKAIEELAHKHYLQGQLEQLNKDVNELSTEFLEELERTNAELEARIRDLIKKQLETRRR